MKHRDAIEDALKLLAEREGEGRTIGLTELAEGIGLPGPDAATGLAAELAAGGLIAPPGAVLTLTPTGRVYALQVLRAHRMFETYLAQQTGLKPADWHAQANIAEHRLTPEAVDALGEQLGNPPFDPHGDPIPSPAGVVPPRTGRPLPEFPAGWAGRIVHVEDEPPVLYREILREGLAPDVRVRVEACTPERVYVRAEGREMRLSRAAAGQITATELPSGERFDDALARLTDLAADERGEVVGISPLVRGFARNRLLDLGVVPGSVLEIVLVSPGGDPVAYRIRGAAIALRREQAERILVHRREGRS
jgi:DtxR family transcriptional regulator, Mn-dependent transcriptional regulator